MPLSKFFCSNPPSSAVKRERRKEARPGEQLDAALDLFVEKGFAATRAEEVAARAGVSKGTLFLYFQSKEELFKAVVRENISGRLTEWNAEFEEFEGDSAEMLAYCMNAWWERVGATRASGITKLMMSEAKNFPDLAAFYQREVIQPGQALMNVCMRDDQLIDAEKYIAAQLATLLYGMSMPATSDAPKAPA